MPIRFRCSYCNRLLGIATRKAGTQTTCPHCGYAITVPVPEPESEKTERINVDDLDELLAKPAGGATVKEGAPPAAPAREVLDPDFEEPLSLPPPPPPPKRNPPQKKAPPAPAKTASAPAPAPPKSAAKPRPKPVDPNDPPLFEGDVDEILGETAVPLEQEKEMPPPTSGMDAASLGESASHPITLSPTVATLLLVGAFILMALSFVAGYMIAPRG